MKIADEFSKNKSRHDGLQAICKVCKRLRDKRHYQENKEQYRIRKKKKRDDLREWLIGLKDFPCTDCERMYHHAAMDWDHLPGQMKMANVARLLQRRVTKEKILHEIAKCELVCSNCHRIRTWNRLQNDGESSKWQDASL